MAAWRAIPSAARGALIATVGVLIGASGAILITASGLVDSQISPVAAPSTVTVTAAPDPGLEPVPAAPKDRFGDSPASKPLLVGAQVLEGRYVADAPRRDEPCVWRRERETEEGLPTQRSDGRREIGDTRDAVMTVRRGDRVTTTGCGEWIRRP